METDDRNPAAGLDYLLKPAKDPREIAKLVVYKNPQGLERTCCGMDPAACVTGGYGPYYDLRKFPGGHERLPAFGSIDGSCDAARVPFLAVRMDDLLKLCLAERSEDF